MKIAALLLVLAASTARADKKPPPTFKGCVIEGKFYAVDMIASRRDLPPKVSAETYEGKAIMFTGTKKPTVIEPKCPAAMLSEIRIEQVRDLESSAFLAAKDGHFDAALETTARAMALVQPPGCNSFIARATVLAFKGDLPAVRKDVEVVASRTGCTVLGRASYEGLEGLARIVRPKDQKLALAVADVAKQQCEDMQWCHTSNAKLREEMSK